MNNAIWLLNLSTDYKRENMLRTNIFFRTSLIATILVVISVILFSIIGFFNIPVADDYSNAARISDEGIFSYTKNIYLGWSGRVLSTFILAVAFQNFEMFHYISIFMGLSFILIPVLVLKFPFMKDLLPRKNISLQVILPLYILSFRSYFGEAVFWPTGGIVYVLCLFLYVTWSLFYFNYITRKNINGNFYMVILSITGFILGTAHEQLSLSFLLIFGIVIAFLELTNHKELANSTCSKVAFKNRYNYMIPYIMLIIGTIFLVVAPGNYVRATYGTSTALSFSSIILRGLILVKTLILYNRSLLVFAIFAGFILATVNYSENFKMDNINSSTTIRIVALLLLASLISLLPFIKYSEFDAHRTYFFSGFFLFYAITIASKSISQFIIKIIINKFSIQLMLKEVIIEKAIIFCLVICFSIVLLLLVPQYKLAVPYRLNGIQRHEFLLSVSQNYPDDSIIEVDPFFSTNPSWFHFNDINDDPKYWINQAIVDFYNLGERRIILKSNE